MTARLSLTLPFPPSSNDYWRSAPGRGLVRSGVADSYIAQVAMLFLSKRWQALAGELVVERLWIFFPRVGDLDNRLKVLNDALNCRAWIDDGQIGRYLDFWRRYDDRKNPRVEMDVVGERFATREEIAEHRRKKAEASQKRKATIHRNRAQKNAEKLAERFGVQPTAATYPAVRR